MSTHFSNILKKPETKPTDNSSNLYLGKKTQSSSLEKIKDNFIEAQGLTMTDSKTTTLNFNNENTTKDESNCFKYYCSLCGANVLLSDTLLDSMPRRKTDESIIVLISKIFFKSFLRKDKLMVIKRDYNKYEKQYRYSCQECGVFIAYQSMNYDENDTSDEFKRRSNKIFAQNKKKILYILIDAVVSDPRQSSLYIEMDKIKETQEKKSIFGKYKRVQSK